MYHSVSRVKTAAWAPVAAADGERRIASGLCGSADIGGMQRGAQLMSVNRYEASVGEQ